MRIRLNMRFARNRQWKKRHLSLTESMRAKKRPLLLLFVGSISLALLIGLVAYADPDTALIPPQTIGPLTISNNTLLSFSPVIFFFFLLAITLFSFVSYLFKSIKHGSLAAAFVIGYLLFRINGLTHPLFLILLIALFLTLELLFANKKE